MMSEIAGHNRVAQLCAQFTHTNGAATDLRSEVNGTSYHPRRVTLLTTGTFYFTFKAAKRDGTVYSKQQVDGLAGMSLRICPTHIHADTATGAKVVVEY